MSLKQYRAFCSVQCRRIKTQVKNINVKCLCDMAIQTTETCPAFSCPSISCLDISMVRYFQRPRFNVNKSCYNVTPLSAM